MTLIKKYYPSDKVIIEVHDRLERSPGSLGHHAQGVAVHSSNRLKRDFLINICFLFETEISVETTKYDHFERMRLITISNDNNK